MPRKKWNFASSLREYRMALDMTQGKVAKKLHIERSTYTYYELGKTEPSIMNLKTLSKIFGISVAELLGEKPKRP